MSGYRIVHHAIPDTLRTAALRRLNLELRDRYDPAGYDRCLRSTFFPSIRWCPELVAMQAAVEIHIELRHGEHWADPQLLIRFPDDCPDEPLIPHFDEPPTWAAGRHYRAIVGVALTAHQVAVWPPHPSIEADRPLTIELGPGDVLIMSPRLAHAGVPNRGADVRHVVWYRILEAAIQEAA